MIRAAIYLGIGIMLHAIFVSTHFDWSSVWTLAWVLAWPIMLMVTFWVLIAIAFICVILAAAALLWADSIRGLLR